MGEDLRGLPIFLAGSRQLLVLCGPSYLSRLWCIVEIFTFMHVGGDYHRIIIRPVVRSNAVRDDAAAIKQAYREFASERCLCFSEQDKQRMLEIIKAAFGDMVCF